MNCYCYRVVLLSARRASPLAQQIEALSGAGSLADWTFARVLVRRQEESQATNWRRSTPAILSCVPFQTPFTEFIPTKQKRSRDSALKFQVSACENECFSIRSAILSANPVSPVTTSDIPRSYVVALQQLRYSRAESNLQTKRVLAMQSEPHGLCLDPGIPEPVVDMRFTPTRIEVLNLRSIADPGYACRERYLSISY